MLSITTAAEAKRVARCQEKEIERAGLTVPRRVLIEGLAKAAHCADWNAWSSQLKSRSPKRKTTEDDSIVLSGRTLTVAEMRAHNWQIDVLIEVPIGLIGHVDRLNDYASRVITGDACALHDISYTHNPNRAAAEGYVWMRVCGVIEDPDAFCCLDAVEEEPRLGRSGTYFDQERHYRDMVEFTEALKAYGEWEVNMTSEQRQSSFTPCKVVVDEPTLALLSAYAGSNGALGDLIDDYPDAPTVSLLRDERKQVFRLGDLRYVTKVAGAYRFFLGSGDVLVGLRPRKE